MGPTLEIGLHRRKKVLQMENLKKKCCFNEKKQGHKILNELEGENKDFKIKLLHRAHLQIKSRLRFHFLFRGKE